MAFALGSQNGVTANTTAVTVASAPASGVVRQVSKITVCNTDTVNATVTFIYDDNGTNRCLKVQTLAANEDVSIGGYVLDTTTRTIEIVLAANVTTNQLEFVTTYADYD
jgi:hypothetical protein